jgi:hypothetical protein
VIEFRLVFAKFFSEYRSSVIPGAISRRLRPLWIGALASTGWANRDDVRRWASFAKRAVENRHDGPFPKCPLEVRVRAAVSADPVFKMRTVELLASNVGSAPR